MKIRKVKNSDAESWIKLKNNVWRSAYANIMPNEVFDDRDNNEKENIQKFKSRTLDRNGHIGFVAENKGEVVALADASTTRFYSHYKELGYADLGALYILPEYQHLGLGKKLFDKVVEEFVKRDCKRMVIGVLKDNLQARKAYEKWGGILDTYEQKYEKLGQQYDEVFYLFDLI